MRRRLRDARLRSILSAGPAALPILLLLLSGGGAGARAGGTEALISACADGNMEVCQQLGLRRGAGSAGADASGDPESPLDARAKAFGDRAEALGLLGAQEPPLARGYELVVRDYFTDDALSEEQRRQFFREDALPGCAQHYAEVWLHERGWWPTLPDGSADWKMLYIHMLDHYFGYCVQRPAP